MTFIELEPVVRARYPDLPLHEAYVAYLNDAFKFPAKVAEAIKPILRHGLPQSPELLEAIGTLLGHPVPVFLSRLARIGMNISASASTPGAGNATANTSEPLDLATMLAAETFGKAAASAQAAAECMGRVADSADQVVRNIHGIHVIGNSLVDHISYYGRWMQKVSAIQIAQGHQVIRALATIGEHLGEANSINVSGSGGPDGFAKHVHDFIKEKIGVIQEAERDNHRFFVYHPDTNWYPAFYRLIIETPLPPTFCAKSDDLDTLCRYMQEVRAQLKRESGRGKDIIFHLLIPSWYSISFEEPLHYPDCLQPFKVEGRKHKRKEYVRFNLPAAPAGLLDGVANVLDPKGWNKVAEGVSTATTLPTVGWGINGACLAAGLGLGSLTGLGMLVAIPVWWGTALPAMDLAAPVIQETVYNALCEEAPRVKKEEGESKKEEGESKKEEGESKKEEGESKKEEGESKKEEGESKKEEGRSKKDKAI
ncbi:hypothetical protein A1O3_05466 [Capronia epimyces CBS 606.96]|uniref:Uncharacterized protein n=1 Tax=Capronia epimyces CBS 606.96 TaxID=1182542 RepID=W9YR95_9EURO|nr:uncharacterized protein A1O3_05466 [Capronia epimyces CBS 606.96]EXJ84794.1 hypothetical protein A1O3_05466 [Capronia epimyces CBS 606.96]